MRKSRRQGPDTDSGNDVELILEFYHCTRTQVANITAEEPSALASVSTGRLPWRAGGRVRRLAVHGRQPGARLDGHTGRGQRGAGARVGRLPRRTRSTCQVPSTAGERSAPKWPGAGPGSVLAGAALTQRARRSVRRSAAGLHRR